MTDVPEDDQPIEDVPVDETDETDETTTEDDDQAG
jgi:hypothetical protein